MKDTDDESLVDGTDAGAEPATSTNTRTGYDGIFEFHKTVRRIEEERRMDLTGRTVHGVISKSHPTITTHPVNGVDWECKDHYPMIGTPN